MISPTAFPHFLAWSLQPGLYPVSQMQLYNWDIKGSSVIGHGVSSNVYATGPIEEHLLFSLLFFKTEGHCVSVAGVPIYHNIISMNSPWQ